PGNTWLSLFFFADFVWFMGAGGLYQTGLTLLCIAAVGVFCEALLRILRSFPSGPERARASSDATGVPSTAYTPPPRTSGFSGVKLPEVPGVSAPFRPARRSDRVSTAQYRHQPVAPARDRTRNRRKRRPWLL